MSNKLHFFRQANPYIINNGGEGNSDDGNTDAFIATFRTTTSNESIDLRYLSNGTYSGTIDWGDGTVVANTYANRTHTYASAGDYDVTVLGDLIGFRNNYYNNGNRIINIKQWGAAFNFINSASYFLGCPNLDITATDTLDLTGITNLQQTFDGDTSLIYNSNIADWDTSNVSNMSYMFRNCTSFNQDISNWNFSGLSSNDALRGFMVGKDHTNYDANYYDNLLIKWNESLANGGLNNNNYFTIDMGGIKYTANGAGARQSIINKGKITINDGGQI